MRPTNVGKSAQWAIAQVTFVRAIVALLALAMVAESARADITGPPPSSMMDDVRQLLEQFDGIDDTECESLAPKRLPDRIKPIHYELIVHPDLDTLSFEGQVRISAKVEGEPNKSQGDDGKRITLHADSSVKIHKVRFADHGHAEPEWSSMSRADLETAGKPMKVCHTTEHQMLVLEAAKEFDRGSYISILIYFSGRIRDDKFGLYRDPSDSDGDDKSGKGQQKSHYSLVTNFEHSSARLVFPCFDEPNFKATFALTLVHPSGLSALANTDPIHRATLQNDNQQLEVVTFERTPPMSSYLVAFYIGEFDTVERKLFNDKLAIRIRTPPGRSQQAEFALDVASRALPMLQDYFSLEFPLKKIDLAGVNQINFQTKENWGLIIHRNDYLLVDLRTAKVKRKASVAKFVIRSLAYQWLGDLVTVDWWSDMWLNEGLATWLCISLTQQMYPEFDTHERYLANTMAPLLKVDSRSRAVGIVSETKSELTDCEEMFNNIDYIKAGAIIGFMHNDYVGPGPFKTAVRRYLAAHQYGNANADTFLKELEAVSGLPVVEAIGAWARQPSHPLIEVDVISNHLVLSQRAFPSPIFGKRALKDPVEAMKWLVPINIVLSDGARTFEEVKVILNDRKIGVKLPDWFAVHRDNADFWLKVNANFSGLYEVQYSERLLGRLGAPIERKTLSPGDRFHLIVDAVELMRVGLMDSKTLMQLLLRYTDENSPLVISAIVDAFKDLVRFSEYGNWSKLKEFGRRLFWYVYRNFLRDESFRASIEEENISVMGQVMNILVVSDYDPAIDDLLFLFDNDKKMNSLPWEYREPVFKAVAKEGTDSQFYRLMSMYRDSKVPEEFNYMASGLRSATDSRRRLHAKNVINSKLGTHNVHGVGRGPVSSDSVSDDPVEFPEVIERWNNRPLWV